MAVSREKLKTFISVLLLVFVILLVFEPVRLNDFVSYDDGSYVVENPHVREGFSQEGVSWAFRTFHAGNWHPLTWLSHMLDCQLFGLRPAGHHVVNVLIHAASVVLLFLFLKKVTGAFWLSLFTAAIFGVHPLRVESIAWAAERKDVLSTFFWILSLICYVRYTQRRNFARYILLFFVFCIGLTAKPMLVTLPFVLLLLDYWPLRRLSVKADKHSMSLSSAIVER